MALGFLAVGPGIAFRGQIYWGGLTTRGAVWVRVLGNAAPVFPLDPPTLVSLPAAFAVCVAVSLLDGSRRAGVDRAGYAEHRRRMLGGAVVPAAAAALALAAAE